MSNLQVKILKAKLERNEPRNLDHVVPGIVVALLVTRSQKNGRG